MLELECGIEEEEEERRERRYGDRKIEEGERETEPKEQGPWTPARAAWDRSTSPLPEPEPGSPLARLGGRAEPSRAEPSQSSQGG